MAKLSEGKQKDIWGKIQHVLKMRGFLCRDCIVVKGAFPVGESIEVATVLSKQQKKRQVIRSKGQCRRCRCESEIFRLPVVDSKPIPEGKPWFCEENIQKTIIDHLRSSDYSVKAVDYTTSVGQGVRIIVEDNKKAKIHLFIHGYYGKSIFPRSSRLFKEAIFDLIVYMRKYRDIQIAIGFPAFRIYTEELRKINWIREILPFRVFWVTEKGAVFEG